MKKLLILGILVMFLTVPNISHAWWDSNWQYRAPITIDNTANSNALTDYQVKIVVDTATLISDGKMNADCSDIRFVDEDDLTPLSYWIESGCNSANTIVWVKVPSVPASSTKTIYMYYGNPSATSESNGTAVFDFFDDFDGTSLDTSKWTSTGTITVSGGELIINDGATTNGVVSNINFAYPIVVEAKSYASGTTTTFLSLAYDWIGTAGNTDILSYVTATGDYSFATCVAGTCTVSTIESPPAGYAKHKIVWTSTQVEYYLNDTLQATITTNIPTTSIPIRFNEWGVDASSITVDYVFVRKYTSQEPTTSVGAEEALSTNQAPQITIYSPENKTYYTFLNASFVVVDDSAHDLHMSYFQNSSVSGWDSNGYEENISYSGFPQRIDYITLLSSSTSGVDATIKIYDENMNLVFSKTHAWSDDNVPTNISIGIQIKKGYLINIVNGRKAWASETPEYSEGNYWSTTGACTDSLCADVIATHIYTSYVNFTIKAYFDGSEIYSNDSYVNNTLITFYLGDYLTDSGTYNFTVWANDTDGAISQQSVIFTIGDWEIINETYNDVSYETSTESYSISLIYNKDLLGDIGLNFYYNSSYAGTSSKNEIETDNGWNATFTINHTHPLIQNNETIVNFEWKINTTNESVASHNQTLVYAYWIDYVSVDPNTMVELENFDGLLYYSKKVDNSQVSLSATAYAEGTTKSCTSSTLLNQFTCSDFQAQRLSSGITESRTLSFNFTISYDGDSRIMSDSTTYTVDKIYLAECNSSFNDNALNINLYSETTEQQINGSVQVELTAWKSDMSSSTGQSYMLTINATPTAQICAYPTWTTLTMDAQIRANSDGYYPRNYYINDLQFQAGSNAQTVNVYLLNESDGAYSLLKVYDISSNQPISGVYIRVQRYSPSQNAYVTMFIDKTNSDGIVSTYLVPLTQEYYFEIFGEDGTVYKSEKDVLYCELSCPPYVKTFYIDISQAEAHLLNNIEVYINYENNLLNVTFRDKNGVSRTYKVDIYSSSPFGEETLYDSQNTTGATAVYTTTLSNDTNYIVYAYALNNNEWVLLGTKDLNQEVQNAFGDTGILLSLILLVFVIMVSLWLESYEMLLLGIGIVTSAMFLLHIAPIGRIAWVSMIILISVALYFGRKKVSLE